MVLHRLTTGSAVVVIVPLQVKVVNYPSVFFQDGQKPSLDLELTSNLDDLRKLVYSGTQRSQLTKEIAQSYLHQVMCKYLLIVMELGRHSVSQLPLIPK
jgi:Rhabdovirus nucleocapsid protein